MSPCSHSIYHLQQELLTEAVPGIPFKFTRAFFPDIQAMGLTCGLSNIIRILLLCKMIGTNS
jgi:hypothetical protein